MAHADMALIAMYLTLCQLDVRRADIVLGKDVHGHGDGYLVLKFHNETLMVHHIVIAMIDTPSETSVMQLIEYHIIDGLALGHIKIADPLMSAPIEVNGRIRTGALYLAIDASVGGAFGRILLTEPS